MNNDVRVELKGNFKESYRILSWADIVPYIPELKDKVVTSFNLSIIAGSMPEATIEYRAIGEIRKESITLCLSSLDLDLSGKVTQKTVTMEGVQ